MSLVVTSNRKGSNEYERQSTDQAAYRYRNNLVYPIDIEPHSEVAVQSVKVNKNGLIKIDRGNRWFQWFNRNLRTDPEVRSVANSTGWPIMCGPDMFDDDTPDYVSLGDFVARMTEGMKEGFPHPDADKDNIKCEILTDTGTTGSGFKGFQLQYNYLPLSVAGNLPASNQFLQRIGANLTITDEVNSTRIACTGTVTPRVTNPNVALADVYPISHQNGEIIFDCAGLQNNPGAGQFGYNNDWMIGLQRATNNQDLRARFVRRAQDDISRNKQTFDFCICCEQLAAGGNRFMKLGHLITDPDGEGFQGIRPLSMKEIYYYENAGDDYDGGANWNSGGFITAPNSRYNMSTNTQEFDMFKFEVQNEKVIISALSSTGGGAATQDVWYVIASYDYAIGGTDATSRNFPKPAGQTCWNLYPKVVLSANGKHVDITNDYTGRDTGYTAYNPYADWYARMIRNGQSRYTLDVDTRYYNIFSYTVDTYVPKGNAGAGATMTMDGYENIVIVSPDTTYIPTGSANMGSLLGYLSRAVLDSATASDITDQQTQYQSDSPPDLSQASMFVRLDNFTQKSYNSGTGRPSKILYHLPRFDNSNRDVGTSLYYEPQERTYVKLNNTETIKLNEINISFCDSQERLVEDLTGQTIVCLHFRKSQK